MLLMDAIEEYARFIKFERWQSPTTILNNQNRLRFFHKWLIENGYLTPNHDVLNTPLLRRYLHWLVQRRLQPTARSHDPVNAKRGRPLQHTGVLGHSSLVVTSIYLHTSEEQLKGTAIR